MSDKKAKDGKLKKEVLQMMGERDESIRQAFGQFDQKVGQGFSAMEIKFAVIFEALKSIGLTDETIQEIANKVQQAQQANTGGDPNEQNSNPTPEGIDPPAKPEAPSDEGGDEHFG